MIEISPVSCRLTALLEFPFLYVLENIAAAIVPQIHHGSPFFEINPGIGCLTTEMLNVGVKNIHLIESNQNFMDYLKVFLKSIY